MFNRDQFTAALESVATKFEKTAPTVVDWCDFLANAKDDQVTIADLHNLSMLANENIPANYAANQVYHLQMRLGRDTDGHCGF